MLKSLNILNYRNIREASLEFSPKLNCLVGLNGQGKTNVLDAIYLLSFAKSAFTSQDSLNITHGEEMALVQGIYNDGMSEASPLNDGMMTISCGLRKGVKKQFRKDKKDYPRLIDHIGLIPLVMISPSDQQLIDEGSDERRRFMDVVISQLDRRYLDCLTKYNALLKQRNALLKQYADSPEPPHDLLEVLEWQMVEPAEYIYKARTEFFEAFEPYFAKTYNAISGRNDATEMHDELPQLRYVSQLLKQVGSQGQQRTFVLAMKLAQALYIGKPILLLDDIFDRLDSERVERIVEMVQGDEFGQIFITDTDRQHLTDILKPNENAKIFHVENGRIDD